MQSKGQLALAWAAFAVAALFFLYEFVARIQPSLAADAMRQDLEMSGAGFGLFSSLFFWIYAPMQIVVGLLLDRYGVKRMIIPATIICSLGVLTVGVAETSLLANVGRILTGLGASFAFVGALYVVNHYFPAKRFALLSGLVNAIGMIGAAIGAVWLADTIGTVGWRVAFVGTGIAGGALATVAILVFARLPGASQQAAAGPLILPLREVMRSREVWLIAVIGSLMYVPINVFGSLWGNAELVTDHHLSAVGAEAVVALLFWGMALGSVLAGAISDRNGGNRAMVIWSSWIAAALWLLLIFSETESQLLLSILLLVCGALGGVQMLTFAMAKSRVDNAHTGTVVAFVNMIGIGSAIPLQPLVGAILDETGPSFSVALLIVPVCLIFAGLIALGLKRGSSFA